MGEVSCSDFLDGTQLLRLKLRAMRAGVWFRGLRGVDRALVDLTLRVAVTVRSGLLARSLLSVARRLGELLENRVGRAMREVGFSLARKLSQLAQRWGYGAARGWVSDIGFVRFLAVMHINGCLSSG